MMLENYIHEDLHNTNITLLAGSVVLLLHGAKENISLQVNQAVNVGQGTHKARIKG